MMFALAIVRSSLLLAACASKVAGTSLVGMLYDIRQGAYRTGNPSLQNRPDKVCDGMSMLAAFFGWPRDINVKEGKVLNVDAVQELPETRWEHHRKLAKKFDDLHRPRIELVKQTLSSGS